MRFKSCFSAVAIGLTVLTGTSILPTLAQEENTPALTQEEDTSITPQEEEEGEDEDENAPVFTQDDPSFSTQREGGTFGVDSGTGGRTLLSAPRIDFSSNDGNGTVNSINWTGTKNFNYSISLRSIRGDKVYVSFQGVRDFAPDSSGRRLTGDTTSSYVFRGAKDGDFGELAWSGVRFRVCKRVNYRPDSCGSWSRTYRRP